MTGWTGITMGDPAGIGPEVILKALAAVHPGADDRYLLIGNSDQWHRWNEQLPVPLPLQPFLNATEPGHFHILDSSNIPLLPSPIAGSAEAAAAAIHWLREGATRCLNHQLDALVTGPVNKEAIIRAEIPFIGQTEFLAEMAHSNCPIMMLLGQDDRSRWLRVALATTHIPLRQVPENLRSEAIERAIELAAQACEKLGLPRSRIGVCGLNPHAGEGGKMGTEEIEIITPAVQNARRRGVDAVGPVAADALFYMAYRGDFDAVVAMYHDQGLAPLKMIGFEQGVNWTLGLPFVRTSPDHGTAYDIAGRGVAQFSSMQAAIRLARQLTNQTKP
jgi:4-hydroxythreonine-4-phosphate dehydrogenase